MSAIRARYRESACWNSDPARPMSTEASEADRSGPGGTTGTVADDDGEPGTGIDVMPSKRSMVVRSSSVASARPTSTAESWAATVPDGGGLAMTAAWRTCSVVELTASSRPTWILPRADRGTVWLDKVGAEAINFESVLPLALDASTMGVARAAYPWSV